MIKTLKWLAIGFGGVAYIALLSTVAYPAGTATLVQLVLGSTLVSTGNPLPITCTSGCSGGGGGGLSVVDQTAWTQGASPFTPNGGVFNDTATLSSGQEGTQRLTTKRAALVDVDPSGNALYTAITAAVPCLNATAFNTNSYTNAQTNPANCDLHGNLYVNVGTQTPPTSLPLPTGAATSANQNTDPCHLGPTSYLPITATTSLVKVIATGVSAKKIYICQLLLTVTAADNVAVFEATTGSTCATSPIAVYGAGTAVASAANGFPFPANGGVSLGSGGFSVGRTTVNNNDLCIATSAATPLTGGITYATQ